MEPDRIREKPDYDDIQAIKGLNFSVGTLFIPGNQERFGCVCVYFRARPVSVVSREFDCGCENSERRAFWRESSVFRFWPKEFGVESVCCRGRHRERERNPGGRIVRNGTCG